MAIIVEHDKRKHEILQKSLDVFVEEGYEDATFQKIADRCGITRTTLYIYFNNKYDIFLGSIKELLSDLESSLVEVMKNQSLSSEEMLKQIVTKILEKCESNKKLFSVLLNYLMQLKRAGIDPNERVQRRVVRVKHILSTILIGGIDKKEFKEVNIKDMNELLYGLIEASIFRIAVLNQKDINDIKNSLFLAIESIKK